MIKFEYNILKFFLYFGSISKKPLKNQCPETFYVFF